MSYTRVNYPSAFATEGNPLAGGFPGEMDPHVHGVNDTMDVDDEDGYFSLDVSELLLYPCGVWGLLRRPGSTRRSLRNWPLLLWLSKQGGIILGNRGLVRATLSGL